MSPLRWLLAVVSVVWAVGYGLSSCRDETARWACPTGTTITPDGWTRCVVPGATVHDPWSAR